MNPTLAKINWSQWMYLSELSPVPLNFTTLEANEASDLANEFVTLNGTSSPAKEKDYLTFYSNLKVVFQDTL